MHSQSPLIRATSLLALTVLVTSAVSGQSQPLPLKYVGPPTVAAITSGDLMTRLYVYADDSLMGRRVGTEYNLKATAYIEREVRRLGLKPAGEDGGYFQSLPLVARGFDTTSTFSAGGVTYRGGKDFLAANAGRLRQLENVEVVFGGALLDTAFKATAEELKGKLVVFGGLKSGINPQAIQQTDAGKAWIKMYLGVARVSVGQDSFPPNMLRAAMNPTSAAMVAKEDGPISLTLTRPVANALFSQALDSLTPGAAGKRITSDLKFNDSPRSGRNVIAVLPGSDPKLRGQFVVIGAHNDHIGFNSRPVDHDSMKVWLGYARPQGADGSPRKLSPEDWTAINTRIAELRKVNPTRADSIWNGADDDGSGSVSLLELAEAFAKGVAKPRRSILLIWQTGEESGMWGSGYFMDHPTVSRDSLVADINIDMVGRGAPSDVTGQRKEGGLLNGADRYVQLVGSRRLSTELGNLVEEVNKGAKYQFKLDYALDANGHPQNIYCRSDHWSYAKWGVPAVFFTTGGHSDYHQVTDEPQYIRYDHMALLDQLIFDTAVRVANLDHRVVVDGARPDPAPAQSCQQ